MHTPENLILLVEDSADDEILTLNALRRGGVTAEITVVRDGAEALDYLLPSDGQVQRDLPKLVLLDLNLPKVSGLKVLLRMRTEERTRHLPVVVLTSSSEREDINKSYKNGTNAYVRKSINFEEFMDSIRCLEKFWLVFNHTISR